MLRRFNPTIVARRRKAARDRAATPTAAVAPALGRKHAVQKVAGLRVAPAAADQNRAQVAVRKDRDPVQALGLAWAAGLDLVHRDAVPARHSDAWAGAGRKVALVRVRRASDLVRSSAAWGRHAAAVECLGAQARAAVAPVVAPETSTPALLPWSAKWRASSGNCVRCAASVRKLGVPKADQKAAVPVDPAPIDTAPMDTAPMDPARRAVARVAVRKRAVPKAARQKVLPKAANRRAVPKGGRTRDADRKGALLKDPAKVRLLKRGSIAVAPRVARQASEDRKDVLKVVVLMVGPKDAGFPSVALADRLVRLARSAFGADRSARREDADPRKALDRKADRADPSVDPVATIADRHRVAMARVRAVPKSGLARRVRWANLSST